jgi:hypothetical protein
MSRVFCPGCGSANTLLRVTMEVGTDGKVHYRGGYKKMHNLRGTKVQARGVRSARS